MSNFRTKIITKVNHIISIIKRINICITIKKDIECQPAHEIIYGNNNYRVLLTKVRSNHYITVISNDYYNKHYDKNFTSRDFKEYLFKAEFNNNNKHHEQLFIYSSKIDQPIIIDEKSISCFRFILYYFEKTMNFKIQ